MMGVLTDACIKGVYSFSPYIYFNNEQLLKDCCQIPYSFHKYLGYRAVIVTAKKEEYTYLDLVKGLELDILETPGDINHWIHLCCEYISENYKKIDIMFCFGAYPAHSQMVQHYKKLRPDGKVILKLDANIYWEDRIPFKAPTYEAFLSQCNVITVESKRLKKHLSQKWPYRIDYVPNGTDVLLQKEKTDYSMKENTILTVGRIGTSQKANEILMEAFQAVADKLPHWKLKLIGSIEESFMPFIEQFFTKYPQLQDQIIFTGKIINKVLLENEYKKAKIFALSSRYEGGTPNVWVEAARNGCCIVCSRIDAVDEATNWEQCGKSFDIDNVPQLSQVLLDICTDESYLSRVCNEIQEYREQFFSYEKIVHKLEHLVNLPPGEIENVANRNESL